MNSNALDRRELMAEIGAIECRIDSLETQHVIQIDHLKHLRGRLAALETPHRDYDEADVPILVVTSS